MRALLAILVPLVLTSQTAITELSSIWEMDIDAADRIAWDAKGDAHAMYFGTGLQLPGTIFGSGFSRAPGTQLPFNSGGLTVPGELVDTGTGSFSYCVWVRPSSHHSDPILGRWSADIPTRSWLLSFNAIPGRPLLTYQMTDGNASYLLATGDDIAAGELAMVCMKYDAERGEVGVSVNNAPWTEAMPSAPFQVIPPGDVCSHPAGIYDPHYPCTVDWSHIHNQFFPSGSPVIGRTMFWNGYVPTDAELAELYNGGAGRDAGYFGLSFTPPERPLDVALIDEAFAADDDLPGQQGLYWLRPYPLKFYDGSLAAAHGDYVWLRGTDHTGNGGPFLGFSDSPETLPASWADLSADLGLDPADYANPETPHLVWNPETSLFHLYAHSDDLRTGDPFEQVTLAWTSPDLESWAFAGRALEPDTDACPGVPCYNHTGYAIVVRNGPGDWTAQSLLTSNEPSGTDGFIRLGLWTSADGLAWSFDGETLGMVPKMPYRNHQNQRVGSHMALPSPPGSVVVSNNYVSTPVTQFEFGNPAWLLFEHPGDNDPYGDWLQDVRAYEEADTVWLYAKWSYQEPSVVRLYRGTLPGPSGVSRPPVRAMSHEAAPNPFGRQVDILFALSQPAPVEIAIYDVTGRRVRVLINGWLPAGGHRTAWNGRNREGEAVPAGVYFYRIRTGGRTEAGQILRLR